jgi:hypothetical protein
MIVASETARFSQPESNQAPNGAACAFPTVIEHLLHALSGVPFPA